MKEKTFSRYEVFIIAILTFLQFTIILDFMILSPLGVILLKEMSIQPDQFGMVVSAYAVSAGISGLLAAGFADKFDRKKLLLFFYTGFIIGTFFCAIAPSYQFLLAARIFTGLFGGVIGSISFAIVTDLFRMEVRGRVMGFLQTAFASSQVLGIPIGLYLANKWGWHSTFLMIVGISIPVFALILLYMKPVDMHLQLRTQRNAFSHLIKTISEARYFRGFTATILLATGGFMLMPFASTFSVNNLGIDVKQLPLLYAVTGIFSIATGPFIGKLSDSIGKYSVFVMGSVISIVIVGIYCNLGITPLWAVMGISVVMFVGVSSRIISSQALLSALPDPQDRGAFMAINSSIQQISGAIATFVAGLIVVQKTSESPLENYDVLGYIVIGASVITIMLMYRLDRYIKRKPKQANPVMKPEPVAEV
jgi:predicted MFS family arabinose efflux permease